MAQSEVIKELLVSLAYKTDGSSEKKAKESVKNFTALVEGLAAAAAAAAAALAAAVVKISAQFDQLYFASQRTNAAVGNIRAFSYAVSQMGGSASDAQGSIENLGKAMRNPGIVNLIQSLGVSTTQGGKLRDTVDVMGDLGKALGKMPRVVADEYAKVFGLDDRTLTAMIQGTDKWQAVFKARQKELGLDPEKAAENAKNFMQVFRDLQSTISTIVDKLASDFSGPMLKAMKDLDEWLRAHYKDIKEGIEAVAAAAVQMAQDFTALVEKMKPVWEAFDQLAKSLGKDAPLTTAFEAFAVYLAGSWLSRILGVFAKVKLGWLALATVIATDLLQNQDEKIKGIEHMLNNPEDNSVDRSWFGQKWHQFRDWGRGILGLSSADGAQSAAPITGGQAAENAKKIYAMLRAGGLDHEGAVGILASNQTESGFNPNIPGDGGAAKGLFQYHKDRRDAILAATGLDVWSPKVEEQVQGALWEMQFGRDPGARAAWKALTTPGLTAAQKGSAFSRLFERPARDEGAERGALAEKFSRIPSFQNYGVGDGVPGAVLGPTGSNDNSRSVVLNQETNVSVIGGGNPGDTAAEVVRHQAMVNAGLLRNAQGAVR